MPLVVPGLTSANGGGGDEWMSKLMGKQLGEEHNETVSPPSPPLPTTTAIHMLLLSYAPPAKLFSCTMNRYVSLYTC